MAFPSKKTGNEERQVKKRINVLGTLLLLALLPFASTHAQAPGAAVRFDPPAAVVELGAEQEIAVLIENVDDLYAFDMRIDYDPAAIAIVDADPGTVGVQISQGAFLDEGLTVLNQVDEGAGVISYATTQLNPSASKGGSGTLLLFRVRGLKMGSSALAFESLQLSDRDGFEIVAGSGPGSVTVPSKIYWLPLICNSNHSPTPVTGKEYWLPMIFSSLSPY